MTFPLHHGSKFHSFLVLLSFSLGLTFLACGGGDEQPTEPEEPEPQLTTVEVTPDSAVLDSVGTTVDFDATGKDQKGGTMSGVNFSWSASDTSVATVNQSGLARAEGTGTVTISAEARGVSGSAKLLVEADKAAADLPASVSKVLPARFYGAAVWDPERDRMLVYGGSALGSQDDMFSYDPSTGTWTRLGSGPVPLLTHEAAWDGVHNRMLIFGGNDGGKGYSERDELWAYDPQSNSWTELNPSGNQPSARDLHTMVWVPKRKEVLMFAGKEGDKTANLNELWSYDPAENAWTQLNPDGPLPDPRRGHTAAWDSARQQMLVYGGWDNDGPRMKGVWSYRPDANRWKELATGSDALRRFRHGGVFNPNTGRMLVFGGCCGPPTGFKGDLWSYDPEAASWNELSPGDPRPAARNRITAQTVWDPTHKAMLIYGGQGVCFVHNDLWAYVPRESRWVRLSRGERTDPLARAEHSAAWLNGKIYLFGGCNGARRSAAFLAYDPSSGTVDNLTPSGPTPEARVQHAMVAAPDEGMIYMFGGQGGTDIMLNDLWRYDLAANEWTELETGGEAPKIRKDFAIAWDPVRRQVLLFGGKAPDGFLADLWAYDVAENRWTELAGSGSGPSRRGEVLGIWNPETEEFLVYGGWFLDSKGQKTLYNEVWSYDPKGQSWQKVASWDENSGPPHRVNGTFIWNPSQQRALLFGGRRFEAPQDKILTSDLWAFDPAQESWTELAPSEPVPPDRTNHITVWQPESEKLFLLAGFGGESRSYLADVWSFSPTANTWTKVKGQ